MLVLSRKRNESIHIGEGIVVTVTEVRGNRVRVGISAPPEVSIRRGEIQPRIEAEAACAKRAAHSSEVHLASAAS